MDCLTQHYDAARTGWNNNEPDLTPVTVHDRLSLAFSQPVDGQIYAQPLYVNGLDLPTFGAHNVVFVATEDGSVYAFDAEVPNPMPAGAPGPWYWKQSLVPSGERPPPP
jgi:outer membrane protein assembly factor BamB